MYCIVHSAKRMAYIFRYATKGMSFKTVHSVLCSIRYATKEAYDGKDHSGSVGY